MSLAVRTPRRGPLLLRLVVVGEKPTAGSIQQVLTDNANVGFAVLVTMYSLVLHGVNVFSGQ
jgi:hypothetical protein